MHCTFLHFQPLHIQDMAMPYIYSTSQKWFDKQGKQGRSLRHLERSIHLDSCEGILQKLWILLKWHSELRYTRNVLYLQYVSKIVWQAQDYQGRSSQHPVRILLDSCQRNFARICRFSSIDIVFCTLHYTLYFTRIYLNSRNPAGGNLCENGFSDSSEISAPDKGTFPIYLPLTSDVRVDCWHNITPL